MKKMLTAICTGALTLSLAVTPALAANSNRCPNQTGNANCPQSVRFLNANDNQGNGFNFQSLFRQLLNKNFSKTSNNCTFPVEDWSNVFSTNSCNPADLCQLLVCGFDNGFCDENTDCTATDCPTDTDETTDCTGNDCDTDCIGDDCEQVPSSNDKKENYKQPDSSSKETTTEKVTTTDKETGKTEEVVSNSAYRQFQKRVIELVNEERAAYGLSPLKENAELDKVATIKSEDMANLNYFSHTSPTYGSPFEMLKDFGINYTAAGENIAMGQPTPESVMDAWMNSEGHRANILNSNYTHIGVGIAKNSRGQYIWTQTFLRP